MRQNKPHQPPTQLATSRHPDTQFKYLRAYQLGLNVGGGTIGGVIAGWTGMGKSSPWLPIQNYGLQATGKIS